MSIQYPSNAEKLTYSTYEIIEKIPSKFLPDVIFEESLGTSCPRCKLVDPYVRGEGYYFKCECDLESQRFGNDLFIWDDTAQEASV